MTSTTTTTTVEVGEHVVLEALSYFEALQQLELVATGREETPMVSFLDDGYTALHTAAFGPVQADEYGADPVVIATKERGAELAAKYLEKLGLQQLKGEAR